MLVDCAIPVFGRPWQTALSLLTLLRHSKQHVRRIWFEDRPGDPLRSNVKWVATVVRSAFSHVEVVYWKCHHNEPLVDYARAAADSLYRLDFPFQRAWEYCGDRPLVVIHNDMRFVRDELPTMLSGLWGSTVGVGRIGICHACPAHRRGCQGGAGYESYRPSYQELVTLIRSRPPTRMVEEIIDPSAPWPLTECRLNEMFAVVRPSLVRHLVFPHGPIPILGEQHIRVDGGVRWFAGLCRAGFRFAHYEYSAVHRAGYPTVSDLDLYRAREAEARELVVAMPEIEGVPLPR